MEFFFQKSFLYLRPLLKHQTIKGPFEAKICKCFIIVFSCNFDYLQYHFSEKYVLINIYPGAESISTNLKDKMEIGV